ncbi:ribonuclease H-like domain-containing protein [Tanacetum coccineum]|uniref:Ribonuclease H-like domain-containing protein n=1 Tax=Tanacetum coccineum TaxID=301880 RepID=A0ABQ5EXI2_9ASTR
MFKLDIEPLSHTLKNNRDAHEDYLKKTIENTDTIRGLVERTRKHNPSEPLLDFAYKFTKHVQELITPTKVVHLKETTSNSGETQKPEIKVYSMRPKQVKSVGSSKKAKIVEFKIANNSEPTHLWGSNATDVPSSSSLVKDRFKNDQIAKIMRYGDYQLGNLAKDGLAGGIPKLKFQKDHLCSACALGKSKKTSHQPKAEDTNQEKLYLLHMDLCGPMRVESINKKKYILVIVDDYSRFTWVKFLRSKDEAPDTIIKCIKNIQVHLNATVCNVRTDNGTEFVNQTLRNFYENVGISHQTSVARTP